MPFCSRIGRGRWLLRTNAVMAFGEESISAYPPRSNSDRTERRVARLFNALGRRMTEIEHRLTRGVGIFDTAMRG